MGASSKLWSEGEERQHVEDSHGRERERERERERITAGKSQAPPGVFGERDRETFRTGRQGTGMLFHSLGCGVCNYGR